MTLPNSKITLSKIEVARRQLIAAITLWFNGGDEVSIHALSYAAYEIIHVISKKKNRTRDLLFDSITIKDEHRGDFAKWLKKAPNFFKHALNDHDATIEFAPIVSDLFILFSILGLELSGEPKSPQESAFLYWLSYNRSEWLTENGRKRFVDPFPIEHIENVRSLSKREFFEIVVALKTPPDYGSLG